LPQAALIFRLSADPNPLHADPAVARAAGFPRPILHGLCSYGIAARAIVQACCAGDPHALKHLGVRFSAPLFPGETLRTEIRRDGTGIARCLAVEHPTSSRHVQRQRGIGDDGSAGGGRIDFMFANPAAMLPPSPRGKLRAQAIASPARLPTAPASPTRRTTSAASAAQRHRVPPGRLRVPSTCAAVSCPARLLARKALHQQAGD
jgi:hypothetical protein